MYKSILLAYDGSSQTQAALRQSVELAKLCNAHLHLLGIVETTGGAAFAQASGPDDFFKLEHDEIEKALADAHADLNEQGVRVTTMLRKGDPAQEITTYVQEIQADLAVLGHTDKGFIARWLLGSTGAELLRHLPCSLLIASEV